MKFEIAVFVDFPGMNPCWLLSMILYLFKYDTSIFGITFSIILEKTDSNDTGL